MGIRIEHEIINGINCKKCTVCNKWLPANNDFYYTMKNNKTDGLTSRCKCCTKLYYDKNKERTKNYYNENKQNILEKSRKYYNENKSKVKERQQKYEKENSLKISERKKIYRKTHRDKLYAYNKKNWHKYYIKHKEKIIKKVSEYRKNHREMYNISNQKRRTMKKQLPILLSKKQWEESKKYFNNKCAYCGKELPLTQEHFIPLSKGGEYTINNIIPVCKSCNSSKQDKIFFEWYPNQEFYSKEREKNILKFLNYDKNNKSQQLSIL